MRLFLDANILFSGSSVNSNLHKLLVYLSESHTLCTSSYAYEEAKRNIGVKKPDWHDGFTRLEAFVTVHNINVPLDETIDLVEKDRPILSASIGLKCDYLITGDRKDFGHLFGTTIEGVKVLPPNDFIREDGV